MTTEPVAAATHHPGQFIHQNVVMRRVLNPIAVRLGLFTVLYVRGRRTGRRLAVPMDPPFEWEGQRYLVAPFGDCHWARNVRAAGEGELRSHGHLEPFRAIELLGAKHDAILAAYERLTDDTCRSYLRKLPDPADHPVFRIESQTAG